MHVFDFDPINALTITGVFSGKTWGRDDQEYNVLRIQGFSGPVDEIRQIDLILHPQLKEAFIRVVNAMEGS